MNYTLVSQSFGRENEYRRVILTILSFYSWVQKDSRIKTILFTDNPSFFEVYFTNLPIEYVLLTPEKIKIMRGTIDFLHRMKIAMIEEAFNRCQTNILYTDSDTFFTSDPSVLLTELSPGIAFMHTREHTFEEIRNMPLPSGKTFRDFVALIDKNVFVLADGSTLNVTTSQSSWNAGVIMLHQSHATLLPDVYALTDQFYPPTQNHASEQYAFSIVMQNKTTLLPCEGVVHHYWHRVKKQIMDVFLEKHVYRLSHSSVEQKQTLIKKWTRYFPPAFNNHIWMLRDQSIQAFHQNKFNKGCRLAVKAILKNPFNLAFSKDVAYHMRRWITVIGKSK